MTIDDLLKDKTVKPKDKTEQISEWISSGELPVHELLAFAEKAKDPLKATCIEALEYASSKKPEIVDESVFRFVTETLTGKAPRVKWESAKVIGNTAHLFRECLEPAIRNLLGNTQHEGTVVRWSAAFALGEILQLKTGHNTFLIPEIQQIMEKEEKNSILKIYAAALKKTH